eukprot:g3010.t1
MVLEFAFLVAFLTLVPCDTTEVTNARHKALPIVLWHGMGDTCCGKRSVGRIKTFIEENYGIFVYSIGFGIEAQDFAAGYLGSVNDQVTTVCKKLKSIKQLYHGYNAIGFSQGGQFLRAVAQRCNHEEPKMRTLVTLGAQHQGVMGYPGCDVMKDMSILCRIVQRAIRIGVYRSPFESTIIQAQYYKDPFQYAEYLKHSKFLKDINCDGHVKNDLYKQNLISLKKLVMVRFQDDEMVIPRDSAWFSFYNGTDLIPLKEQDTYKEDWIGLKTMDEKGKLIFITCPTEHMAFSMDWFVNNIMNKYLLPKAHNVVV